MTALQKKCTTAIVAFMLGILAIFLVLHLDRINLWLDHVLRILRPVLIGLVLAYLCNPIFRLFERKLLLHVRPTGLRRVLSLLCTYIVLFLIFFTLIMLIVPQLISSIMDFMGNYEGYLVNAITNINDIIAGINQAFGTEISALDHLWIQSSISDFFANLDLQGFFEQLLTFTNIFTVLGTLSDLFYLLMDIIFGLFISLYILNSKEKQHAQFTRMRQALFSKGINQRIDNIISIADRSFGGFLRGKLLDSSLVGLIVYILISIMQVPYALLIAVIIGITDIVPVIGPFIGVIPSAVIILLTDPVKVIPFLLCILVVQQIDGNVMAPKILGDNTGVSSLCVMIAITLLGAIWGLVGMVVAVPLFATVMELSSSFLEKRLHRKGLPVETEHYYAQEAEDKTTTEQKKKKKQRANPKIDGCGSLTEAEKECLRTYALVQKHRLFEERDTERMNSFRAEYSPVADSADDTPVTASAEDALPADL